MCRPATYLLSPGDSAHYLSGVSEGNGDSSRAIPLRLDHPLHAISRGHAVLGRARGCIVVNNKSFDRPSKI
jgi:hypothetical protein